MSSLNVREGVVWRLYAVMVITVTHTKSYSLPEWTCIHSHRKAHAFSFPFKTLTHSLTHSHPLSEIVKRCSKLWIPSVHGASWAAPFEQIKRAAERRDRPCDRAWHRPPLQVWTDALGRRRICQTRSDTIASLTRAAATADQSVTPLENLSLRQEKSREQHEEQETEEVFVRVCVCVCVCVSAVQVRTCFSGSCEESWRGCGMSQHTRSWSQLALCSRCSANAVLQLELSQLSKLCASHTTVENLIGTSQEKNRTQLEGN